LHVACHALADEVYDIVLVAGFVKNECEPAHSRDSGVCINMRREEVIDKDSEYDVAS
jgi:hypothetical protein